MGKLATWVALSIGHLLGAYLFDSYKDVYEAIFYGGHSLLVYHMFGKIKGDKCHPST
jgi:hypothetical protein